MKLEGLYTAIITPFTPSGAIDTEGLRRNIRYQCDSNVQGIVVLGTTGESPTLTAQEKRTIIEIAKDEIRERMTLIVGTGSYSTQQTIEATLIAYEMGADAALIVTPYYNKPTQEGLFRHYAAICEAVPIPICLYNVQGRTGLNLQPSTLDRLASFSSIIGIKECSENVEQITDIVQLVRDRDPSFSLLSGNDIFTLPLIMLGGQGIISTASNLIPGPMQSYVQACLTGDLPLARMWHCQLAPLFKALSVETNPIPLKTLMNACGMAAGNCRLPLCEISSSNRLFLERIINNLSTTWLGEYGQKKPAYC